MHRLTFTYRDGQFELLSQQAVDMRLPARTTESDAASHHDFCYELLGRRSEVLFQRRAPNPIPRSVEVFSPRGDGPSITRTELSPEGYVFTVVLPEVEDAEEVRLLRSRSPGRAFVDDDGAEVVGRFDLHREGVASHGVERRQDRWHYENS